MTTDAPGPPDPDDSSDALLEELQQAVAEHTQLLARQQELINQLRDELRDVAR